MATLVLQVAGAAIGGLFGPVGALVGRAAGALAGYALDSAVLTPRGAAPKLRDVEVMGASEGALIPRVFGRVRIAGQVIWATRPQAVTTSRSSGGKSLRNKSGKTVTHYANLAVALCEGEIAAVRRVFADGKAVDLAQVAMRVYTGGESQEADPLIVAKEGRDNAPAYRGTAYVVLEHFDLGPYGNRVPQLAFEVVRPVGRLEREIRAVTLIPGSTEFGYATTEVARVTAPGASESENRHVATAATDLEASLDELQALCPNLERVSLVVAWFGTDLRAGHCRVLPKVDAAEKETVGGTWSVAGLERAQAEVVSRHGAGAAYGGTPSDDTVVAAIKALKARGLKVCLYPFLMMDVAQDNDLPDPETGSAPQRAYPWRGWITCDPAPGRSDSPDGTDAALAQVNAFFGTAAPGHFTIEGGAVAYSGPDEWSWRRCAFHMARLAELAGGVDQFVIGSELPGLTRVRSGPGIYPAVAALRGLAGDLKTMMPRTSLVYAADWTEYGAHVIDGGREVRFPLDPLHAHPAIAAIGIDWYAPIADWREGTDHLDAREAASIHDRAYLEARIAGGEGFDWYYADAAARAAQQRLPITDGLGKPWIYRVKDLASWWANPHVERVDGQELPAATAWVPRSKPIWITEIGCGAVDKGANAPNVFSDPKSAASGLPPFSTGARDDLMQRRTLEAALAVLPTLGGASPLYGGPMIDPRDITIWTWDARPYPAFPSAAAVWSDAANWTLGHWLTGRLGGMTLGELIADIAAPGGARIDAAALDGMVEGYAVDRLATLREAIEPLLDLYGVSAHEAEDVIRLVPRGGPVRLRLREDELARDGKAFGFQRMRAQESELPAALQVSFAEAGGSFRPAVARAARPAANARGTLTLDLALVADRAEMTARAQARLAALWTGRETARFALPPSAIALTPGDVVEIDTQDGRQRYEITSISDSGLRRIEARAAAPATPVVRAPASAVAPLALPLSAAAPLALTLDLPVAGADPPILTRLAVCCTPWPGGFTVWREALGDLTPVAEVAACAIIGEWLDPLPAGRPWRFDESASARVRVHAGELQAATRERVLDGANLAAVLTPEGRCELIQFAGAELVEPGTWRLSALLRGRLGTEAAAALPIPAGSRFVLMDEAVLPLVRGVEAVGVPHRFRLVPLGGSPSDPLVRSFTVTPTRRALEPRAPAQLRGRRGAQGVTFTWTGVSRQAHSWEVEPPLDSPLSWQIEILKDGAAVRTLTVLGTSALYEAAAERADFGAVQPRLAVRVAQISPVTGPGPACEEVIDAR